MRRISVVYTLDVKKCQQKTPGSEVIDGDVQFDNEFKGGNENKFLMQPYSLSE